MNNCCTVLNQRILEISDGDDGFRIELTEAIYNGLLELKEQYAEGLSEKNDVKIQQIRHKVKPTLAMFEFDQLAEVLHAGKEILEAQGFGALFEAHFETFLRLIEEALSEVARLNN